MKKKPRKKPRKPAARKPSSIAKELAAIADAPEPAVSPAAGSDTSSAPGADTAPRSKYRNRIKERRRVRSGELIVNPKNFRRHPEGQKAAMLGVLKELGKVATLRAVETPAGLMLLDGHLRAELDAAEEWDVDILDLTPAEADYLLATFDPLSNMAVADPAALASLLAEIDTECDAVQAMLDAMAPTPADPPDPSGDAKKEVEHVCPSCGCRFAGGQFIAGEEK